MGLYDDIDKEVLTVNTSNQAVQNKESTGLFDDIDNEVETTNQYQSSYTEDLTQKLGDWVKGEHPYLEGGVQVVQSIPESAKTLAKSAWGSHYRTSQGINDILTSTFDTLGLKGLADKGRKANEVYQQWQNDLNINSEYNEATSLLNPQKALPTIANTVGSQADNMAMSILGGGFASNLAKKLGLNGFRNFLATSLGASVPNMILEGQYLEKEKALEEKLGRPLTYQEKLKVKGVAGTEKVVNSLLESLPEAMLIGKLMPNGVAKTALGKIGKTISGGLENALGEGLTETAQEGSSILAEKALGINDATQNAHRLLNAGALGAIGGQVYGSVASGLGQTGQIEPQAQQATQQIKQAKAFEVGKAIAQAKNNPQAFDVMRSLSQQDIFANPQVQTNVQAEIVQPQQQIQAQPQVQNWDINNLEKIQSNNPNIVRPELAQAPTTNENVQPVINTSSEQETVNNETTTSTNQEEAETPTEKLVEKLAPNVAKKQAKKSSGLSDYVEVGTYNSYKEAYQDNKGKGVNIRTNPDGTYTALMKASKINKTNEEDVVNQQQNNVEEQNVADNKQENNKKLIDNGIVEEKTTSGAIKLDINAIAEERANELNKEFIKSRRKYAEDERKRGFTQNADNLDKETDEYIKNKENQYAGQHNIDFANAIKNKDYNKLISIIAQGKGTNEVSKKIFTKYTGIKLPSNIEGKKNAILQWAGKNIDEYNAEIKEKKQKAKEEYEQKQKEYILKQAISDLEDIKVKNDSGDIITEKEFLDNLYNDGYKLEKTKQGIKPIYELFKNKSGYKFTKPFEKTYIDELYKNGAKTYSKENNITTKEQAINELNKYNITVEKTDTPDITSFDGNGNMYDVKYNGETLLVREEDLTDLDELARKGANESEYLQNAKKIDGQDSKSKKYWSQDTELGARAFAAYLFDKMEERDISNKFLVRSGNGAVLNMNAFKELAEGEEAEPLTLSTVPKGEERKKINAAFDNLFNTIKTRETDKGVDLYNINNDVYNFLDDDNKLNITKTDYDNIDLKKTIKSNKTIGELCDTNELFYTLKDDLKQFSDYRIKDVPDGLVSTKGIHERDTKTIYLNSEVLKSPQEFVEALFHEIEHAKQNIEYERIMSLDSEERTEKDNLFVESFEKLKKSTEKMVDFKKLHEDLISDIMEDIQGFSKEELNNYLDTLTPHRRQIAEQHLLNTAEYYFNDLEATARNNGSDFAERIINNEKYSKIWHKRLGFYARRGISFYKKWAVRTNVWENKGQETKTNEKNLNYYIGLSSIRNVQDKVADIKKTTETKIEEKIKDELYTWHGNIEKDKFDVAKKVNSLINISKQKAKDLSKKYGMKVSDKMVREIMPFLRERTNFPKTLNRNDLRKLFNALSSEDKKSLTNFADEVANKFENYYKHYQEAKGVEDPVSIENHISHIWDVNDKQKSLLTNYFTTSSKYAKQRTIGTLVEGIDGIELDNGEIKQFKPRTLDYAEILKSSSENLIKATYDMQLARRIKDFKYNGKSLVMRRDKAPSDWVDIEHPALNKAMYLGELDNGDNAFAYKSVKVHPTVARAIMPVFEQEKIGKIAKIYDDINGVLKQATLSFSGFHAYALTESSVGNSKLKETLKIALNLKKMKEAVTDGKYELFENEELTKQAIDDGLQIGTPSDLYRNNVEDVISKIPLIGNKILSPLVRANNKILWDYLHNSFKIKAYELGIANIKDKNGNITKEQRREVAQWVNDSFGGQAWELLGIRPSSVRKASRLLLSPDWNFSTIRQFNGMFNSKTLDKLTNLIPNNFIKEVLRLSGAKDQYTTGVRGKLGRSFWIYSALVFAGVMYNAINAMFRKKDMEENPDLYPEKPSLIDYTIWGNSIPTDDFSSKLMPYIFIGRNKDGSARYLRLGKQYREVPEMVFKPVEKLSGKASSFIQLSTQLACGLSPADIFKQLNGDEFNQPFYNQEIWDGFGQKATKREGLDLAKGEAMVLAKNVLPFTVGKTIKREKDGSHKIDMENMSAWDMFAQTSKGLTYGKAMSVYGKAYQNKLSEEEIQKINEKALKDGALTQKQIKELNTKAKDNSTSKLTEKYKDQYKEALKNNDQNKIKAITTKLEKSNLNGAEISKIYTKALKDYYKELGQ